MKAFEARTTAEPTTAELTTAEPSGVVVVVLSGDCDLSVRDRMTTVLLAAVDDAPVVAVDLTGVTFMDSSGLHALITAHHSAQRRGRRLYVRGATGVVGTLLDLTGLAGVLDRD